MSNKRIKKRMTQVLLFGDFLTENVWNLWKIFQKGLCFVQETIKTKNSTAMTLKH